MLGARGRGVARGAPPNGRRRTAQKGDWREIRTLASEETGALNQRLRPLGHPAKGNLTGRIRTIDLRITTVYIYSPPLYQLSYGEIGWYRETPRRRAPDGEAGARQKRMRHPGIEPGPPRWQRGIITTRLMTLWSCRAWGALRHPPDALSAPSQKTVSIGWNAPY